MQNVMLKIKGTTYTKENGRESEQSVIEYITEGVIKKRGRVCQIMYEEPSSSEDENVTTSLTVTPKKVRVSRHTDTLEESNIMEFENGKRYDGEYYTPYGPLGLELFCNSISGMILNNAGNEHLCIDYNLSLKGLQDSRNIFDIEILNRQ